MLRRLLILNGVAIIFVLLHHASGYGFMALFDWTDRYMTVTVPDYSQIGSLPFYYLVVVQQLDWVALPAMMFVSGFFISSAVVGRELKRDWKVVSSRVKYLIIPFFVWTTIFFIFFARTIPSNFSEIIDRYYYIPLLIVFYLLSIFLVPLVKKNWKLVLIATACLELGRFALSYTRDLGIVFAGQENLILITPRWLPPNLLFWFVMGLTVGLHLDVIITRLERMKWYLLAGVIIFGTLTLVEYYLVARTLDENWLGTYFEGFARYFYSFMVILAFLAFDTSRIPYSKSISEVGGKSLGIYLAHSRWMYIAAVFLYRGFPGILGNQLLYQSILIAVAIGGSLFLMWAMRRSPAKRYYRYVFG